MRRFTLIRNIISKLGFNSIDLSGGVILEDFDNDGFLDIATTTTGWEMKIRLFHNNGEMSIAKV